MHDPALLAGRYQLGPIIGEGGFGIVYDGFDVTTRSRVAIKCLRRVDPERIFHFKQEFRLLADCRHPNLIRYYELLEVGQKWYLVMEHVAGTDLINHVRGNYEVLHAASTLGIPSAGTIAPPTTPATSMDRPPTPLSAPTDPEKEDLKVHRIEAANSNQQANLRKLLTQLAAGLEHLHKSGLVHRDLTPRNIMVDTSGRLVILDFGLAMARTEPLESFETQQRFCVGTPKYMAPEQAAGDTATHLSDWYAVGVLLYESLTNVPPFVGRGFKVMRDKQEQPPLDPLQLCPGLPTDLCALSLALLATNPQQRPENAGEKLRQCALAVHTPAPRIGRTLPEVQLIGRTRQLAQLDEARRQVEEQGVTSAMLVRGPSGIGKTALINHFVQALSDGSRLVLRSRCYQHETLPFKALDGLMDAIGQYLMAQNEEELQFLLPRQVHYLARLFPSLRLVRSIERSRDPVFTNQDPHEMRRRGFQALRVLLHQLAERQCLVITIDDIQWGDEDSINALIEVLAPPNPPSLLLIMCARSDDSGHLVDQARRSFAESNIRLIDIELDPLSISEAGDLTRRLLQHSGNDEPAYALLTAVHRESGGHPLLLQELVLAGVPANSNKTATLRDLLAIRFATLPTIARRLLECVAVAGRPRPLALLLSALGHGENLAAVMHLLSGERLIRMRGIGGMDEIAIYHDKVAEIALQLMSAEQVRDYHIALADALANAAAPEEEADALSMHYLAAGNQKLGQHYCLIAANHAMSTLAFDRAADLFRMVIDLLPVDGPRPDLQLKLADALANAGHGVDAARAYSQAGTSDDAPARLHALQRAAGQYLRSGYMDDGLRVAQQVLREVGVRWQTNSSSALLSLLWLRLRLRLRGLAFTQRKVEFIPPDDLLRMDLLWSLGHGLGGVDTIRGAEFHARHLLQAFKSGEPYRISRGLAWEAILTAAEGGKGGRRRARQLVKAGHNIAQRLQNVHAAAWNWAAEAYGYWCEGRWDEALSCCTQAAQLYREECQDITWELGSVYVWCWMPVLCYSGRLSDLRQLAAQVEREFGQLGDLYTLVTMATMVKPWLALADGDPDKARRDSAEAVQKWSREHWHLQHLFDLMTRARCALYRGDGAAAMQALERDWPRYIASMQDRLQIKRIFMHGLRGQAVVMAIAQGRMPASKLKLAADDARQLEREGSGWASAYAASLHAGIAAAGGDLITACADYAAASLAFRRLGMLLHAAAAQRRSAECLRGDDAAESLKAADVELERLGVREPDRFTAVLVAGVPPRAS